MLAATQAILPRPPGILALVVFLGTAVLLAHLSFVLFERPMLALAPSGMGGRRSAAGDSLNRLVGRLPTRARTA